MYLQKINLKKKYALVTGAGKGLGRACSIALAEAGATVIALSRTSADLDKLEKEIKKIASESSIEVKGVSTGLTEDGIDLGSRNFLTIKQPKIALIVGDGIRSYDAGEIWHLLDVKYDIPVTKIDVNNLKRSNLSKYSHIILPDYTGNRISANQIKNFIDNGGNLIAYRSSIKWLNENEIIKIDFIKSDLKPSKVNFDQKRNHFGAQLISGAIFNTNID